MFWSIFFQTLTFIIVIIVVGQIIAKVFGSKDNNGDP